MSGLVGHLEMKKSGPDWQNISAMADTLEQFNIPEVSRQDIEEAICILDSNSYQLLHQSGKSLNGVFIVASMFNHVCYQANSRPSFGKNYAMKVIATDDIEQGQEITTSYLEPFHTNIQRRAILLRGKSFECSCQRCADPTEFGTFASSFKCQKCEKGYMLTNNSLSLSADWFCDKCDERCPGKSAMEFDNNLAKEGKIVNRNNLANIDKFLRTYEQILHPNHIFLCQLKIWMIEGLGRLPFEGKKFEDIQMEKVRLIREVLSKLSLFESPYSYLSGILQVELADMLVQKLQSMFSTENLHQKDLDPFVILERAQEALAMAQVVFKNEDPTSQDHSLKMKINELRMTLSNFC